MRTDLLEQARQLEISERAALAVAIWDSVADDANALPVTAAQKLLLEQRLAAFEADPFAGDSWENVRARLEKLA